MWARNGRWILPEIPDFHVAFRNLLHAVNLRYGTERLYFPYEGRRAEDFYRPEKSDGFGRVWTCELGYQRPVRYLQTTKAAIHYFNIFVSTVGTRLHFGQRSSYILSSAATARTQWGVREFYFIPSIQRPRFKPGDRPRWHMSTLFFALSKLCGDNAVVILCVYVWSRHCVTRRKVAGSIPDGVIVIFHWYIPFGCTMALGLIQPLTEMSIKNIFWGVNAAGV